MSLDKSTTNLKFVSVDVKEHVILMPSYIGNIEKGVFGLMNRRILQYSPELGGFMVSYSRPVIQQTTGTIIDDYPQIHFELRYSACVLQPTFGSIVSATVTRIGDDYITCLYCGCISIFVPSNVNSEEANWIDEGSNVTVKIVRLSNEDVLIGELVLPRRGDRLNAKASSAGDGKMTKKGKKRKRESDQLDGVAITPLQNNDTRDPVKEKRKKKRKKERSSSDAADYDELSLGHDNKDSTIYIDLDTSQDEPLRKKKKRASCTSGPNDSTVLVVKEEKPTDSLLTTKHHKAKRKKNSK